MEAAASTRRLRVNIGLAQWARGPLVRSGACELKVLKENSGKNLNCPTRRTSAENLNCPFGRTSLEKIVLLSSFRAKLSYWTVVLQDGFHIMEHMKFI